MKLMVFPEARRAEVEAVVQREFEDRGGTEDLSLVVVRVAGVWQVTASGLNDAVLERGFAELVEHALRQSDGCHD